MYDKMNDLTVPLCVCVCTQQDRKRQGKTGGE